MCIYCLCLSVSLSVCLSLSFFLSFFLSPCYVLCLEAHPHNQLPHIHGYIVSLSVCLSVSLSVCLSLLLSVPLLCPLLMIYAISHLFKGKGKKLSTPEIYASSASLPVCLSICLFVYLSLFLSFFLSPCYVLCLEAMIYAISHLFKGTGKKLTPL